MRILLLHSALNERNGWVTYTQTLTRGLEELGHTVLTKRVSLERPLNYLTNPLKLFFAARRIKKAFRENNADILHITAEPFALCFPFLPQDIQKRTVLTLHGSYAIRPLLSHRSSWNAYRYYQSIPAFIAVSDFTKKETIRALEKRHKDKAATHVSKKTTVIYNAITTPVSPPTKKENSTKQILLVGGVKPIKGVLQAIDAVSAYQKTSQSPVHLAVVGTCNEDDPYVQQCRARIEELSLQDTVTLTGPVSDSELTEKYQEADLYLMPSQTNPHTFEGFGLVFLEANAYGVPCIGPETSGAAEAIKDNVTGYHCDAKNPLDIAKKIQWILDDNRIDPASCTAWAAEHTSVTMAEQVQSVYESVQETL